MNSSKPLVSVLIPSYNHERFVEEAIRSVLGQTYPHVELVVVDDCSNDRTAEIVVRLAGEFGFTFLQNAENMGLNATLERALAASSGEYVSIVSSDDAILPEKIARQVAYLHTTGKDGVYGGCLAVRDGASPQPMNLPGIRQAFEDGTILEMIYCRDTDVPLLQSALLCRRAVEAMSPYRHRFQSDDWVMMIKLLEQYDIGFIDEPMFKYRIHQTSAHRDVWAVLPMRVEVAALATPERLRLRALANIFFSLANVMRDEGRIGPALKLLLSALVMDPSPQRLGAVFLRMPVRALRRLVRR